MNIALRMIIGMAVIVGTAGAIELTTKIEPPAVAQIGREQVEIALAGCCDPIPVCPPVCSPPEAN